MSFKSKLLSGAMGAAIMFGATEVAMAQNSGPVLDIVTVTSQKREQTLQDVPISVVAVSGADLRDRDIPRLEEMSALVPNFSVQQDPIGDKIMIRGIQSGNNAGLEQSVGIFLDGVYRGRGVQSRFAFLDVERIEVLRGPQGTLFGKNTVGGALNIVSAAPSDEASGALSLTHTFEGVTDTALEGHVNMPFSDAVRFRLAGRVHDLSEGHMTNIYYNEATPQLEEYVFRGTLEMDLSDESMLTLRAEYGDFDQFGQPFGTLTAGPLAAFGVESGRHDITNMGSSNPVLDIGSNGNFYGDISEFSATYNRTLGNGDLTAILAYSAYEFTRELDADFSPLDLLRFDDTEDFSQTSFELRYAGSAGDRIEYLAGLYYQDSELFADGRADYNTRGTGTEIGVDTVLGAGCAGAVAAGANPATNRSCILSGLVTAFDGTPLAYTDLSRYHFLDQTSEVWAVFAQSTFNLTDDFRITAGARFANEEKTATQGAYGADFGTTNRNDAVANTAAYAAFGAPDPFTALAEGTPHVHNLARDEDSFTWSLAAEFDASDDVMLYATASTGFKAGGFNSFAMTANPDEAEYEEEEVLGFEAGAKMSLADGAAELNLAAFHTEFSDLQTAIFTGSTTFIVQNAAEATSSGLEVDGRWALTDNLMLTGSAAWINFEFEDFPNAACTVDQILAYRIATTNPLATNQDCSAAGINDLTGRTSENTPEFSYSLGLDYRFDISTYEVATLIDVNYQGEQYRQADLDPFILDDAFTKINAVVRLSPHSDRWSLSLIGKNLTDVETFNYGNDTPLVDTTRQFIPMAPRTFGVRFDVNF